MGTYMVDAEECIKQINAMSKTDFHQRILRGLLPVRSFLVWYLSALNISRRTKSQHICQMLVQAGIPFELSDDADADDALERIAFTITTRAVKVI